MLTTSDGGQTWTSPTRVNDDPIGDGKFQDLVWANYDTNGNLLITWRDCRNASGTGYQQPTDMYCSVSTDNGNTFGTNVRLSNITVPFDTILDEKGNDFMTCSFLNDTIYASWGDVRTGHLTIFFTKTSASTGLGVQTLVQSQNMPEAKIFPNPSDGKNIFLQLISAENSDADISIYDVLGKKVFEKKYSLKSSCTASFIVN
ncbi:MAG TPA: T9SS type A sorting domain-containing protein [Bacteroidia bacterium]|nr:T9SS type A sorting domain-containing protein [Bacteroidia bacterium]